ncbi:unnamed protein product [Mytilus edulis]|uniref:MYND-type domain-containing protein n=1 Tax=Mytilus edulis TaxID=6550 RepID=A0A8S3QL61_MYTED|nr:unnamed protein product [Mytilus edulis]
MSVYIVGSQCEGTYTSDHLNDLDILQCDENGFVVEDIEKSDQNHSSLLIVTECYTSPGYCKLQLVFRGIPFTHVQWPFIVNPWKTVIYMLDRSGRVVLYDLPPTYDDKFFFSRSRNKPASKCIERNFDMVICYRCKAWPSMADEWLQRHRHYEWPTEDMVLKLKSLGFFVIKKGHPLSSEIDLEWRISFSLQERELMFSLTDVQHKCYMVLKMLNRDIIKLDYIASYHWKTCLFYTIEENSKHVWKREHLFYCVRLCIHRMLKWVKCGFCPNYFIPGDNLFDGRLNNECRIILEKVLREFLNVGFNSLGYIKSANICYYMKLRRSAQWFQWLQTESQELFKNALLEIHLRTIGDTCFVFNRHILELYYFRNKQNIFIFIKNVWLTLTYIQRFDNITEHTADDTKTSLSLLTPHIYTCLASNISAMAIQHPYLKARGFLLFGAYTYFMKGGLSGYLKFVSVLYAVGMYEESEWYLDQLDDEYIKRNTAWCICRYMNSDITTTLNNINKTSQSNVSTCIWFLPSEVPITLDAMQYEMFRNFDTCLHENKNEAFICRMNSRAIVDSSIYLFLLKFEIKKKLRKFQECNDAFSNMLSLYRDQNVRHVDVACNLMAWCLNSDGQTVMALRCLKMSWQLMNYQDFIFVFLKDKMKHFPFNAAKIHALVSLYKAWFAKKPTCSKFCVQCFDSIQDLKKCSRCKITAYCSKQCQKKNWTIHKSVCKIVSRHSYQ